MWDELLSKARFDYPSATENRLQAIVYRQIQEKKHGKKPIEDPELTLKPNILRSQKSMVKKDPPPLERFIGKQ